MEDVKTILRKLCSAFRYDLSVMQNATKVYENAVRKGYDKKHKRLPLIAGSLYFYCKSTGKPIIMAKITEELPVESEEINAVYNDLKKDALN